MDYDAFGPVRANDELCTLDQGSYTPQRQPAWRQSVTPERILRSFNTRAFKRRQPERPELMHGFISQTLTRRQPISFVMYWGKGLRPLLAGPEFASLAYLASMKARIKEVYAPGASFTLVFTDTHANLNGHSQGSIHSYFQDLELAACVHQFNTCLLSTLVKAHGLRPERRNDLLEGQIPPPDVLAHLRASALKWFKGQGSAEEGAIRYFQANMVERKVIERAFPRSIFVTFNGKQLISLFPEMLPIFYMFSLKHGVSDKPWFLPPDYVDKRAPANMTVDFARSA
jgi:L-tyrosine isonitrile synthase